MNFNSVLLSFFFNFRLWLLVMIIINFSFFGKRIFFKLSCSRLLCYRGRRNDSPSSYLGFSLKPLQFLLVLFFDLSLVFAGSVFSFNALTLCLSLCLSTAAIYLSLDLHSSTFSLGFSFNALTFCFSCFSFSPLTL
jgi:hypothetical protein